MILVTGASGLLGTNVVALARAQGREVAGLYHRHEAILPGATLLPADLMDESALSRVFHDLKPEAVVHCAAATHVDWCQEHPEEAHRINVAATARIAEITAQNAAQLLYISTDAVFDGSRGHYSESDRPAPVNVYADTKLRGEREVLRFNPRAVVARVTLYGWNAQSKQSLAEWVLGQLILGKPVPGFTDVIFCPILANDVAEILLTMLDRKLAGTFHVVGSEAVSKYKFARRVAAAFGFDPGQVFSAKSNDSKLKAPRPRDTSLNTERVCTALGCSMPDVNAGLHKFFRLQPEGTMERLKSHVTGVRE